MSEQEEPERSEQEYHPADPHFNPAHPDNAAWRSGPTPPDMPAEAGIVAMFQDPKGPIGEGDVRVEPPPPGSDDAGDDSADTDSGTDRPAAKKPARRSR